jgi:pyrimidine operon attenuation protein / uracil phosphoribosyltransferase
MRNEYDEADVRRMIEHLGAAIAGQFAPDRPLNVVGVRTRGETIAGRITELLKAKGFTRIGRGVLDITLYRDDLSEIGPRPMVRPTHLDIDIDGVPLLLVDDVIFTGRSARAALDAVSDFGRPAMIRMAVLIDRGGRELPIQPDFVGFHLTDVPPDHRVNVKLRENDGAEGVWVEPRT